jgi:kynurenine 3-monooxygenase
LGQCIESSGPNFKDAISTFSDTRAPEVATLVQISHDLDRPGALGTVRFLVPIILDGIFSKLLPSVFAPNIIRMIQSEEITFKEAASRKRLDRVRQLGLLGTGLLGLVSGGQHMIMGRLAGFVLLPSLVAGIMIKLFVPDEA